ncbi:RmlC-like cupin domain-containing protein [Geopyxis carbonaria]|nr:RmlC-like cupin domain-containing protein [Geopyxis carbonaria]
MFKARTKAERPEGEKASDKATAASDKATAASDKATAATEKATEATEKATEANDKNLLWTALVVAILASVSAKLFPRTSTLVATSLRRFAATNASAAPTTTTTAALAAASTTMTAPNPNIQIRLRPSKSRGHADHGWLKTFHTFSFASYYNAAFDAFGSLRVINEDRVAASSGFPTHPHARFEIWSYIVSGSLGHKDSMGNVESLRAGDVQLTYAGSGIRHSEYNDQPAAGDATHFLQIWAVPPPGEQSGTPRYYTRRFGREEKMNKLCRVMEYGGKEEGREETAKSAPLKSTVDMYATILETGRKVEHRFRMGKGYVHLIMKSGYETPKTGAARISVGGVELREGDGAFLEGTKGESIEVETLEGEAEFVLFDLE